MASLSVFQPYVDKENTGARVKQRNGSMRENGVKVFQSHGTSLSTPRSALRDVNKDLSVSGQKIQPQKPLAPVNSLFKEPALRKELSIRPLDPSGHKHANKIHVDSIKKQKGLVTPFSDTRHKVITKKPEPLPEIDHMHIYDENEDFRPKRDPDFNGLVDRLRKWRPPCLFGTRPDSEDEDEKKEDTPAEIFSLPEPEFQDLDLGLTALPFDEEELLSLPDIPLPSIDDLPLPFADDSLDIEPNMGTLEIYDLSTPYSLSPNSKQLDDSV